MRFLKRIMGWFSLKSIFSFFLWNKTKLLDVPTVLPVPVPIHEDDGYTHQDRMQLSWFANELASIGRYDRAAAYGLARYVDPDTKAMSTLENENTNNKLMSKAEMDKKHGRR